MTETRRDNYFMLIFVLAISSSFAPLSADFFAPSMPSATRDLGVSAEAIKNSLYIFFIGYGLSPFFWGAVADRFGRRITMLGGVSVYVIATLGCYFADSILEMSLLRLIQGAGAASGVVVSRAALRDIYGSSGATKAISGMFLIMVWVPILAPLIGGYIGAHLNWRISFLVMALVALFTLLGSYLWQHETVPEKPAQDKESYNWRLVLMNGIFARHALANMFCVGTMLLFIANFSYLSEHYYQFSAQQNGYILAAFNASLSVGIYLVRLFAPRIGVEKTIYLGLWIALAGWLLLWGICLRSVPELTLLLPPILFACLGTGMVISLSVGQALVPFTYTAGVASALFVCVQSAGSSLISFLATPLIESSLGMMASVLLLCSILAMTSMKFRYRAQRVEL